MSEQDLPGEAIKALEQGSKIEAIKLVRLAHHVGLKEAKEIVERYIARSPAIKMRMDAANAEIAGGALRWLLVIVALGILGYYFYGGKPPGPALLGLNQDVHHERDAG